MNSFIWLEKQTNKTPCWIQQVDARLRLRSVFDICIISAALLSFFSFSAHSCAAHHQIPDLRWKEGSVQRRVQCAGCCLLCVLVFRQGLWTQRTRAVRQSDCLVRTLCLHVVWQRDRFFGSFFIDKMIKRKLILSNIVRCGILAIKCARIKKLDCLKSNQQQFETPWWNQQLVERNQGATSSGDIRSVFGNSNGFPPPWSCFSLCACMDLWPLTVQTSSAVSVWTPATSIIISICDNTLSFPSLQDCQVSPVAVGFGCCLAAKLRQAGSCSVHHSLMTFPITLF